MRWMTSSDTLQVFEKCFHIAFKQQPRCAELSLLPHWVALGSHIDEELTRNRHLVDIRGGYVYNFSSAYPLIRSDQVNKTILVPHVQSSDIPAGQHHWCRVPCDISSAATISTTVEDTLRPRIGSKRYRDMRRHARKASQRYRCEILDVIKLTQNPNMISQFSRIHQMNTLKYGHAINMYDDHVLAYLLETDIRDNILMLFRRNSKGGEVVQVSLFYHDPEESELYCAVQGICRDAVDRDVNLYTTLFFNIYEMCLDLSVKRVYLGRGNQGIKRRLGANEYSMLEMLFGGLVPFWIRKLAPKARRQFDVQLDSLHTDGQR